MKGKEPTPIYIERTTNPYRNVQFRPDALYTPFVVLDSVSQLPVSSHVTLAEAMDARDGYESGEQPTQPQRTQIKKPWWKE